MEQAVSNVTWGFPVKIVTPENVRNKRSKKGRRDGTRGSYWGEQC